jgi:hypothetical protein
MTAATAVDTFLARFFGEGNDLSPSALADNVPELAVWLDERLARLRQDPGSAHILPRRIAGKTRWYGLAHSSRQLKELSQVLEAFTVPAYAKVDRLAMLNEQDPVDAAVIQFTGGNALMLEVLPGQQEQVRRALELFAMLDISRPRRELALSRPLGRLLREFEMTVLAAAEDASEELLREIEQTGQLSAQNVLFLRIRRLAGLRQFDAILRLPELATVLAIRRPARVSASLLEAVYITEIAGYEADGDIDGALQHFEHVVLQKYPALFKSRHGLQTPEAIKSFMLHTLAVRPDDAESRARLLGSPDLSLTDLQFLRRLASWPETPAAPEATLDDAASAALAEDYDAALQIAARQPASAEQAELLIRCAFEIDSMDAIRTAADAFNNLGSAQQDALISSRLYSTLWAYISEALSGEAGARVIEAPTSWTEWFQQAAEGRAVPNAIQIAERAVVEWSAEDFSVQESRAVAGFLNRDIAPQAMRLVKDALPHFLQFIERSTEPARHRELLDDIAVLLMSEEDLGVADVQVVANLAGIILEIGLPAERYRQLVEDFCNLWERVDSPAYLDAAIDMLDVLLTQACPNPGVREVLFRKLIASFQRWQRRIRPDQWMLLAELASELGASEVVKAIRPSEAEADGAGAAPNRRALAGKMIAIYTLTDPAATRAADFLTSNFDDVVVEVSNDHVASDRLRTLARAADVFVVATRSAKHAATTFIEAQRPPGRPIVYADGKGSASLIRALFSYISA